MAKRAKKKRSAQPAPSAKAALEFRPWADSTALETTDARNIVLIACTAAVLRVVFFILNSTNNPVFHHPIMDGLYHDEWAKDIIGGNFWGDEVFFRAPLYPYVLAGLYKISGPSVAFAVGFQHVLGVVSTVLVYLLARRVFRPAIALVAGMLAATYWPFLYFEGDLLIVTLIVFLDVAALYAMVSAMQNGDARTYAASGALLGLSAVARPSVLIVLPIVPVALFLNGRRNGARSRRWVAQAAIVWAMVALVITPVLVRNYVVGRDLVPIASQGGVNFYIGNNPQSDGATAVVPGTRWDWWGGYEDAINIAETDMGRPLKPSEVSNYYFRKGLDFVFGSPQQSIPLTWRKFQMFWAGGERSNNKSIYFFWHLSGMGGAPLPGFWLVGPLGIAGAILLWFRRRPETWLLQLFVVGYSAGVIAFFVNGRFRLPIVPVLVIFAAYAVARTIHALRRPGRTAAFVLALLVVCFVAVDYDFINFPENKIHLLSVPHYTLGNAYLKMGDSDAALREYEEALRTHQRYPTPAFQVIARNVIYNLGRMYWGKGRCERAVPFLEQVGGSDRYAVMAKNCLADCYSKQGRDRDAIKTYEEALALAPGNAEAVQGLARAYRKIGDVERADALLRELDEGRPQQ